MDIKDKLERIRLSKILVSSYEKELNQLLKISTGLYDTTNAIAQIRQQLDHLITDKKEIRQAIEQLENPIYITILRLYYYDKLSFEDIAIKLYYHKKTVIRYHNQSVRELEKIINEKPSETASG